jgi:hypothetical protein
MTKANVLDYLSEKKKKIQEREYNQNSDEFRPTRKLNHGNQYYL